MRAQAALARLRAMGCPGGATNTGNTPIPTRLTQPTAPKAAVFDMTTKRRFSRIDRLKIVFVDGVFDPRQSDDLALEGLEIERLSMPGPTSTGRATSTACWRARGQDPVQRPLRRAQHRLCRPTAW
jgi:Fe-S cluster assembly protein SufD